MYNSRIIVLIPARGGSKGIPGKNIRLLGGEPLISYAIRAAKNASLVSAVYVSTDSPEIARVSESYGAVAISRPVHLATDTAPSESALLHFAENVDFDVLVFIQCTAPFTVGADIDCALEFFLEKKLDSLLTVARDNSFLWNEQGKPINYDYHQRPRRQDREPVYRETGAFYITTKKNLVTSGNRLSGKIGMYVMPDLRSLDIDLPEDFFIAEILLEFFQKNGGIKKAGMSSHPLGS